MKVFAISDFHLSINNPKPMNIFGPVWEGYLAKIENDWHQKVSPEDIVLIAGDLSWAMRFEEAKPDLDYICGLPGKKVILKGNHDYWWNSITELKNYLHNNTFAIQNDAIKIENIIICGSRGWMPKDAAFKDAQDEKIYRRELIRMELSLKHATTIKQDGDKLIVMTHFPPFNFRMEDNDMTAIFEKYNVDAVVYGHLHNEDKKTKLHYTRNNIQYYLTSCDIVENTLVQIL